MKKYILFMLCLVAVITTSTAQKAVNDTTVRFKKKIIQVQDSVGQVKVKVFDTDSVPYKSVYEGIFSDGKSYEKWTVKEAFGFDLSSLIKKKKLWHKCGAQMEAHWAGFGWGFSNISNAGYQINDINGVSLKSTSSQEFFYNFTEKLIPITSFFGLTSGLGFDWRNYYFDLNKHLVEGTDGIVRLEDAPEGIRYTYSRLRTCYLTAPLFLEWQPAFDGKRNFYITAGVIGGIKLKSATKIKYDDSEGDAIKRIEDKGLKVNPVMLDFCGQVGFENVNAYVKYSPFSIFEKGKGPDVRAVSAGLVLNF